MFRASIWDIGSLFMMMALTLALAPSAAHAEADGPDWWVVSGVGPDDVLNIRAEPSASSEKVGQIPPDGQGLRNLGCTGQMSFAEWKKATEAERERAKYNRWCKIEYRGTAGWVAGWYLVEGSPPPEVVTSTEPGEYSFGAWRVFCDSGACESAYQYGRGGSRPTIIRVVRGDTSAPEILVEGGPFVPTGEVKFAVDGDYLTGGLVSTLEAATGGDLDLPPDDITYTLVRRMQNGTTLQLTVPRAQGAETVEFDLEGFGDALRRLTSR